MVHSIASIAVHGGSDSESDGRSDSESEGRTVRSRSDGQDNAQSQSWVVRALFIFRRNVVNGKGVLPYRKKIDQRSMVNP
jgi:hypothetical protein